jgi:hypothetical protein
MLIAAVIGALGIVREDACRQLAHLDMVFQAVTADPFARTGFI